MSRRLIHSASTDMPSLGLEGTSPDVSGCGSQESRTPREIIDDFVDMCTLRHHISDEQIQVTLDKRFQESVLRQADQAIMEIHTKASIRSSLKLLLKSHWKLRPCEMILLFGEKSLRTSFARDLWSCARDGLPLDPLVAEIKQKDDRHRVPDRRTLMESDKPCYSYGDVKRAKERLLSGRATLTNEDDGDDVTHPNVWSAASGRRGHKRPLPASQHTAHSAPQAKHFRPADPVHPSVGESQTPITVNGGRGGRQRDRSIMVERQDVQDALGRHHEDAFISRTMSVLCVDPNGFLSTLRTAGAALRIEDPKSALEHQYIIYPFQFPDDHHTVAIWNRDANVVEVYDPSHRENYQTATITEMQSLMEKCTAIICQASLVTSCREFP
nr:hypothetical protein CFP56_28719 [Quercus suber]